MQNIFCAQRISCERKLCCQRDFLVQIKLSNQINSGWLQTEHAFHPQPLHVCVLIVDAYVVVYKLSQGPAKRPMMHMMGVCTSLTAHNEPQQERQCVRNLSGVGSVSCIFASLNTVCCHENLTEFCLYFFIASLHQSLMPLTLVHLRPYTWKHAQSKQTDWATAWRAALLTL